MSSTHQKVPQSDVEANAGAEESSNFLRKWMIIGIFIFFSFVLLVLLIALCLVFIEVISFQQQQQPVPFATIKPNLMHDVEDLPVPEHVIIEDTISSEPLVPSDADNSKIQQQPIDQKVELGKETTLNCKFSDKVHCRWMRKSDLVDISIRYSYIEPEQEDGNFDCSIKITKIKSIDFNEWQCVGIFNDQSTLASDRVKLELLQAKEQIEVDQIALMTFPKDVTAEFGEDVRLDCKFNEKVSCAWMRRGEHIEIQGRYEFIEPNNDVDERRSDCSIVISNVKKIDEGEWMCSSMADSNSSGQTSPVVTLTINT